MSSVNAVSSDNYYLQLLQQQQQQQGGIGQDLQALQKALSTNSLSAAQQAFFAIQQNPAIVGQGQASQPTSTSNVQNDVQGIGKALDSGDLSGAQKALTSLRKDLQHVRHGHHRHQAQGAQSNQSTQSTGSVSTDGTPTSGGTDASTFANLLSQEATRLLANSSAYSSADTGSNINLIA